MQIEKPGELSLRQIEQSGQCFRWRKAGENEYLIPAFGRILRIREKEGILDLDCSEEEFKAVWKNYFDLERDYAAIHSLIPGEDRFLSEAAEAQKGIRILNQEPWETLVTFTMSQRKNIPAIKSCVEAVCERAGEPLDTFHGETIHAFPDAETMAELTLSELQGCALGYRAQYIWDTARRFALGFESTERLKSLDDNDLYSALCNLRGVGRKIASCTMLFGFGRTDAFPVDVWMDRMMKEEYPAGFDYGAYRPYNGIMQQYLFAHYRSLHGK